MIDIQAAKEELRKIRHYDHQVNAKLREIETLKSMIQKITAQLDRVVVMGGAPDYDGPTLELMQLEDACNKLVDRFVDHKRMVLRKLDAMSDPRLSDALYYYYVDGLKWSDVAHIVFCSDRQIYYLHSKAIQEYAEISEKCAVDCS